MDSSSVRGYTHRPAGREGSLDSKKGSTFSPPSTADQAKLDSKAVSLLPRIVWPVFLSNNINILPALFNY